LIYNEETIIDYLLLDYLLLDEAVEAVLVFISEVDEPVALPTELGVYNYDLTFNKNPQFFTPTGMSQLPYSFFFDLPDSFSG